MIMRKKLVIILAWVSCFSFVFPACSGTGRSTLPVAGDTTDALSQAETSGTVPDLEPSLTADQAEDDPEKEETPVMEKESAVEEAESSWIAETDGEAAPEVLEWMFAKPEELYVDASAIEAMFSQMGAGVRSAVVVRNGTIIGEYFADGYDSSTVFTLQSVSKSITGILMGISIDRGYIGSLDDYAADYLPTLAESEYPEMRQITIRQLLSHTSGLACTENTPQWESWRTSSDWVGYLVSQPMSASPGSYFEYSTGNTHILAAIIEAVTGMPLMEYANEVLFEPIGISSATMDIDPGLVYQTEQSSYDVTSFCTDPAGVGDGGNGFSMTAYDLARIGLLHLQEGSWMGRQIVSPEYVRAATTTQAVRSSDGSQYGFCWWTDRSFGDAGYTGYFAQGHFGQFIFVVPGLDLVVVFTGMLEHYTASTYRSYVSTLVNGMRQHDFSEASVQKRLPLHDAVHGFDFCERKAKGLYWM